MSKAVSRDRSPAATRRGRLRRSDCSNVGLRRVRRGRGFAFTDEHGRRIAEPDVIDRLRSLAIPPAWTDVWICPDPLGHLQATGIDAAGRKQYLYHPRWREHRDRQKFDKMLRFAAALPGLRSDIAAELAPGVPTRAAVLACAARLLDIGFFRIGSEEYADEDSGIGLATIRKDHVTIRGDGAMEFRYPAKGGIDRHQVITDPLSLALVRHLRLRRSGGPLLLAYRASRRWEKLRSDDINEYLKDKLGEDVSAKDFRTWNATVLASVSLATAGRDAATRSARKRATDAAARQVSQLLGNTPAVARRAYIDPRVFDRYNSGWTIAGALDDLPHLDPTDNDVRERIEAAVVDLLTEKDGSPALENHDVAETKRAA